MKLVVNSTTGETELVPYAQHELDDLAAVPAPDPKNAIRAEITALLASKGLAQKWQVESAAASVLALAMAEGLTEAQAYAQRPGYRDAKDLLILIALKEAQL